MNIERVSAVEILDSRGVPTLEVALEASGGRAWASVPSGRSTGQWEAHERRDGDLARYGGRGVKGAIAAVEGEIAPKLVGRTLPPQDELDRMLIDLDGTPGKRRMGANTLLAVSLAAARLRAALAGLPLYRHLGGPDACLLPVPCFNVINGGAHADNALEWQEFMIVPAGLPSFSEALRAGAEIYCALGRILEESRYSDALGDEGGYAPDLVQPEEALDFLVEAIQEAGYQPGRDVFLAVDPAASQFRKKEHYVFGDNRRSAQDLTGYYAYLLKTYPILSIEDGLAEEDEDGWMHLTRELGGKVQLVGDDLFVTDPARVRRGVEKGLGNAVLLKPNQIGTLTETLEAARAARQGGFRSMVSHRSGDTTDDFIADLAVALEAGQIKSGAPARGERVAKYNRLLRIEKDLGARARYAGLNAFGRR